MTSDATFLRQVAGMGAVVGFPPDLTERLRQIAVKLDFLKAYNPDLVRHLDSIGAVIAPTAPTDPTDPTDPAA